MALDSVQHEFYFGDGERPFFMANGKRKLQFSATLPQSLIVCMIEQNELALAYLASIINGDPSIASIQLDQALNMPAQSGNSCIFLIDECGLHPPICLYLEALRRICASAKCIVLGKDKSASHIADLLRFELDGFLMHKEVEKSLLPAIHAVGNDKLWVPSEALEFSIRKNRRAGIGPKFSKTGIITRREYEILQLVQARLTNQEIAKLTNIQESTVKFHISNIFMKLQINNRRDLATMATPATWAQLKRPV